MEKLTDVYFQTGYRKHNVPKEKNSGEIITVPDQTPSIRTLLDRHQKGIPLVEKIGVYNESYVYPDIRKMDLVEIQELKMDLKDQKDEFSKQIASIDAETGRRRQIKDNPTAPPVVKTE